MKRTIHYFIHITLFTIIWCILSESFSVFQIALGLILSSATMSFVNQYLLLEKYSIKYAISPFVMMRYCVYLIIQIYKSGMVSLVKIIYGKDETNIYEYHTNIKNEIKIGMLANAVTSTPGTVTIDKEGQVLKILSLGKMDESMLESFEKILGDD